MIECDCVIHGLFVNRSFKKNLITGACITVYVDNVDNI